MNPLPVLILVGGAGYALTAASPDEPQQGAGTQTGKNPEPQPKMIASIGWPYEPTSRHRIGIEFGRTVKPNTTAKKIATDRGWDRKSEFYPASLDDGYTNEKGEKKNIMRNHSGLDIGASLNDPILAVADGEVVEVTYSKIYGNYCTIRHHLKNRWYFSRYAHCNSIQCREGEKVKRGQTIAASGTTGNSTGVHLHFEWRQDSDRYSSCIDPTPFFDQKPDPLNYDSLIRRQKKLG